MTISSFLSPGVVGSAGGSQIPAPDIDRTEWGWNGGGGGGGWKAGKGNTNAALSALTLLAFMFFLNILQSCLKDSMNQGPGVVVMMMPSAPARTKREVHDLDHEWNEAQITELVHNQVESYWNNKDAVQWKSNFNDKYKPQIQILKDNKSLKETPLFNKRISTKLNVTKTTKDEKDKHTTGCKTFNGRLNETSRGENPRVKEKPSTASNWIKIGTTVLKMSKPLIRKIICCEVITCENTRIREDDKLNSGSNMAIWNLLSWLCSGPNQDACAYNHHTLSDCSNPFVINLLQLRDKQASNITNMG